MSISAEPFGSEEAPSPVRNPESSNDVEQVNKDTSVVAVLEKDEERRIQGVDISDSIKGSLDDYASEEEEDDELDEAETVEKKARANQR
jgi:hypothetical protein